MQKDLRRLTSRSVTASRHGRARRRATPMFVTPALETEDLEKARTHLAADRAEAADDPAVVASEALFASVSPPPHPYGVPVSGRAPRHPRDERRATRVPRREPVRGARERGVCR